MTSQQATESEEPTPTVNDPVVFRLTSSIKVTLSELTYFTFLLIGVALLWPWNCFLSASAYYSERFANSVSLVKVYSSTMMTVSTLTGTPYNYYLSQKQKGVDYNKRVNDGLLIIIGVFVFLAFTCVMFLFINMNDFVFFALLMLTVVCSSIGTCMAQNGTMAIVNVLGGIYANAVMVGQAVAGCLPSVALIISILVIGDKPKAKEGIVEKNYGVFVYYLTASLISTVSIFFFWWVNVYTVHSQYRLLDETMEEDTGLTTPRISEEVTVPVQESYVPFSVLWSKLKLISLTIFFTFGITLIFPVFASTVESVRSNSEYKFFHKDVYIPFIYLMWNLGDLVARILCGTPGSKFLITNPKTLFFYSLARLVFIPLFLTCNIHPYNASGDSSAVVNSDLWYILLQLAFGLSNGQLSTSSFMIVGNFCDTDDEKEAAGGFTTVFLSSGLAFGSVFSYLLVLLIS